MPRPIRRCSRDNQKQIGMQMEDLPKWLPSGWSMEIKTRKSGMKVGKTYKCYISSTGCKFYSKVEVFRYLKNGKLCSYTSELNKRDSAMHSTKSASEGLVEKHTVEGLPPGWIKKTKVTQVADRTRKDPYYIDPVTGYEFRSKVDVFRYLESGDLGKCATRPKKRQISDMVSIDGQISPLSAAKKHKMAGNATRRSLFTRQSARLSKAVENELVLESSVVGECLPSMVAQDGETSQMTSEVHQESEGIKNVEGKMVCSEIGFISALGVEVSQERQPLEKLHSADRENSELISAVNMKEKMICAEKGLISSEADVFAEKQPKEKPLDADGESYELIDEAIEIIGLDKMIEKIFSSAQESGCLENTEEKMVCAEKGLISAPASEVFPLKQLSEKQHNADRESSELVSATQESGDLENTGGNMFCAEKGLISAPAVVFSAEKQTLKKPHTADGTSSEPVSVAQRESEGLESKEHKIVHAKNGLISVPSAKVYPEKQSSEKSFRKHKNRAQLRTTSGQDGKELPLLRRASKRLAGLQADLTPDLGMSERALRMVARQSVDIEVNPAASVNPSSCNHEASEEMDPSEAAAAEVVTTLNTSRGSGVLLDEISSEAAAEVVTTLNTSRGSGVSDEIASEAAAEVVTTVNSSRGSGVMLDEVASEEVEKRMRDQAAPVEPSRKLEGENKPTEKPESPLVLPFGDSWPDPCLEFAFKTLTGAIPVDDNLVIGDYFQQNHRMDQDQSVSGFTLPDFGFDGFCQTDFLFQFGATEKSATKQQSSGTPTFTSLGNCGMAASGDGALQQPNGEGGKECQSKVNN
ncbi:hypothetical protein NE237_029684 [Protea cynaroides]|uniref:MBD domain-containing protein n=1 Tax=Protea cynaroides TaxID=273540 RepID=A0A9Q0GRN7_9MAGN|nr:hypothetical protein NE237_029684 [Protea cynaroides]